jgi:hypothetical protein
MSKRQTSIFTKRHVAREYSRLIWRANGVGRARGGACAAAHCEPQLQAFEEAGEIDPSDCYVAIENEWSAIIEVFATHDIDLRCVSTRLPPSSSAAHL